ncbi:MAG: hypothetical protein CVV46_02765 [Spirochaetae bacterium HGW-Spirochaetae-2]|nr:MAG: hypothetical protein CVV46_02765 [Spirochaetae bacterium HGW-Spirochaetae-2]
MKLITVSGPPSSGKTSVIVHLIADLRHRASRCAVVKFDCLATDDDALYASHGIDVRIGLSGNLCPDHFFVSNIDDCFAWGRRYGYDILFSESAGLCNRCSPHIEGCTALCVIDNLMGAGAPRKIGPMLKTADIVVVTKGDVVSQAEREIFAFKIRQANPSCLILHINGLSGQGSAYLSEVLLRTGDMQTLQGKELRASLPSALCSYCLGETRIGKEKQKGNVRRMELD